jgi:hypothetical protein
MAVISISDQYRYTGKGPFDAKSLIKTYAALLDPSTWEVSGKVAAYNGMLTSVWLNKDDTTKNGVYILFDPAVTGATKTPDVANEANWHKLAELSDVSALAEQLAAINSELTGIKTRLATLESDKVAIRRNNDYNYKLDDIPNNNEICLVDVAGKGLRVKIGDGETTFGDLPYLDEPILKNIDSLIIQGYFYQNAFYLDSMYSELIDAIVGRIYIDASSSKIYTYNGTSYEILNNIPKAASADQAGIMKLYDQTGKNTDGTMTQKAITDEIDTINDELDDKFEMAVNKDEELLIFALDLD